MVWGQILLIAAFLLAVFATFGIGYGARSQPVPWGYGFALFPAAFACYVLSLILAYR